MWGAWSSRTVVLGAALAVLLLVCALPPAHMLARSAGSAGWASLAALLLEPRQRELLANSVRLAGATAIAATLVGAPLGVAMARVPMRRKSLVRLLLVAPLALPPYVVCLAWIYLTSRSGLIASALGVDLLSGWTYSLSAAVLVLSVVVYPLPMLATEVALRGVDGRLEEAALLVAPRGRVLRGISLPLASPAIAAAALIVFVLAVSDFGVPALLRVRVYTTEVFTAFAALYDAERATRLTIPLVLVCVLVAVAASVMAGGRLLASRRGTVPPALFLEQWRPAALAAIGMVIGAALLLPVTILGRESWRAEGLPAAVAASRGAVLNSVTLAAAGATAVVALAVWIGYWRARAGRRLGRSVDVALVVLFSMPSTVLGVGLIELWNRQGLPSLVYGTDLMIVVAYVTRLVPLAALILAAAVRFVPVSQEEAAVVAGARWLPTMGQIVFPQVTRALGATWLIAFVLAFGELGTTILIAPPGDATLSIRIYTMIANAPPSQVAALGLLQTAAVLAPLALMGLAVPRRRPQ